MAEDPAKEPRRFALKPKEIEPTDTRAAPGDGTVISVELMHAQNRVAEQKAKAAGPVDTPIAPEDPDAIRIEDLLRHNRAVALRTEPELIVLPKPRPSRRRRDLGIILLTASGLSALLWYIFRQDPQMIGLLLGMIALITATFVWVIYGVMDRY